MDLHRDLPPIIGIADLILQEGSNLVVVDHKTSTKFNNLASRTELVLYAEHARRAFGARCIVGCYDEYRLVPARSRARTRTNSSSWSVCCCWIRCRRYTSRWVATRE